MTLFNVFFSLDERQPASF